MKYTKYSLITALALAGMIGLVGCNEEDTSASGAKTAVVEFGATFPSSGVSKSMIDTNTDIINIKLYSGSMFQEMGPYAQSTSYEEPILIQDINITRTNPTATMTKVPIGDFFAYVTSYDSEGNELDRLNLGGTLAEGKNTLTATMLRGKWTLDTPITLNKTLSTDTARIDSISIIPNAYLYNYSTKKAALDFNSSLGWTELPMLINGANLPKVQYAYNYQTQMPEYNLTSVTETRSPGYIMYFNQFKGLSTNTNALQTVEMKLRPTTGGVGTIFNEDSNNTREVFVLGIDPSQEYLMYQEPGYESNSTFSESGMANFATSKATAYNKVSGNIVEVRTKEQSGTEKCYNDSNTLITCPWDQQVSAAKARKKAAVKGISTQKSKLSKSSYNSTTKCYVDLIVTNNERYTSYYYDYNTSTSVPISVVYTGTWKGDACVHPFSATGAQLSSDDLNITLQRVR